MTLQPGPLAPDFVQAPPAKGALVPPKPFVKGDLAVPARVPLGQAEIVPEAPAGMWGY